MQKTLLALAAVGVALTCVHSPAYADKFYLVGVGRNPAGAWSVTVPMKSIEQCETAGLKLQAAGKNKKLTNQTDFVGYECVLGD
jgi:hypothetical protein